MKHKIQSTRKAYFAVHADTGELCETNANFLRTRVARFTVVKGHSVNGSSQGILPEIVRGAV